MSLTADTLIEEELVRYLLSAVAVDGTTQGDALVDLRDLVGKRIFLGRQPDREKTLTLTAELIDTERESAIYGQHRLTTSTVQVDAWERSDRGYRRVRKCQNLVRLAIVPTNWQIWGDVRIASVEQVRDSVFTTRPNDGSTLWEYRASADYSITYHDVNGW